MTLLKIDPDGDVTLDLGPSKSIPENTTTSLLISSKALSLASPVFAAMFSPKYLEGQRSPSGTLQPISLPSDDTDAMVLLCKVLHYQLQDLPQRPDLVLFKDLALLCDKYDCTIPLRFAAEHWLLCLESSNEMEQLENLLFVSYVFDRPERFAVLSMRIIREYAGNPKGLEVLASFDILPDDLLSRLNKQRKARLRKIEEAVSEHMKSMDRLSTLQFPQLSFYCKKCGTCRDTVFCQPCRMTGESTVCSVDSRRGVFIQALIAADLDPITLGTIMQKKSIAQIAACIATAFLTIGSHRCQPIGKCPLHAAMAALRIEASHVFSDTKGLCLDCVKQGRSCAALDLEMEKGAECRMKHQQSG